MDLLNFIQKHYFFELNRRQEITSSLSIPIGVLTLLIGATTYFAGNFDFDLSLLSIAFILLLVGSIISSILTVIQLFRSYWSYVYQYLDSPVIYKKYYDDLISYYKENSVNNVEKFALQDLRTTLCHNYAAAATVNWENNKRKSAILHKANTCLVWVVVFVFLSAPIFYFKSEPKNTQTINKVEVIMPEGKNSNKEKSKPAEADKKAKPEPPKNVNLRESDEGKSKGKQELND